MSSLFIHFIALIIIIMILIMVSQKLRIAYPIVLVVGGLIVSMIPGLPMFHIRPELIFMIFLPPLLYEAAWYTSWKDFWRWRRVITSFAFLGVLITSLIVAVVSSMLIPGFSLALGFLLGGIVSPPDAVSASSILKTVKVPKRVTAIVEGESLLNDASSLIVFRFALIAVETGHFIIHEAAFNFIFVIVMGILTGIVVGMLYFIIHKWLPTNTDIDIILTLSTPYVIYIIAEAFHFSGVLAVVSGGLFLSSKRHLFLNHSSRLRGSNVWSTFGFILNGIVFILIGLQLPVIIQQLGNISLSAAVGYGTVITFVLISSRILCAFGAAAFTRFISRYITTADPNPGWKGPLLFAWSGMRGVVSLASALAVPLYLSNGLPFPQRNLILFITFVVILLTLVIQGLTLPVLIKWLKMEDPDQHLSEDDQNDFVRKQLSQRSLTFLNTYYRQETENNLKLHQMYEYLQNCSDRRNNCSDRRNFSDSEQQIYVTAYQNLLQEQRICLEELNALETIDDEIIRKYHDLVDVEEEKLLIQYQH